MTLVRVDVLQVFVSYGFKMWKRKCTFELQFSKLSIDIIYVYL